MWDKSPTVCLHTQVSSNAAYSVEVLEEILYTSLQSWLGKLNYYSGDDVFSVTLKQVPMHASYNANIQFQHYSYFFPNCDISVYYLAAPTLNPKDGSYYHGWTSHQTGSKHRTTVLIWTYDYDQRDFRDLTDAHKAKIANATNSDKVPNNTSWYHMRPSQLHSLQATTDHEIGHAFGLAHYMYNGTLRGCNCIDYIPEIAQKSIMYFATPKDVTIEDVKQITDFDIEALLAKYGTDGFGGYTNFEYQKFHVNR